MHGFCRRTQQLLSHGHNNLSNQFPSRSLIHILSPAFCLLGTSLDPTPYPTLGYIPRDNLDIKHDVLDWHGDHLFTNYHTLYDSLTSAGYFVEILSSPLTCFNASQYAALMIVDSEEEWYPEVRRRRRRPVRPRPRPRPRPGPAQSSRYAGFKWGGVVVAPRSGD